MSKLKKKKNFFFFLPSCTTNLLQHVHFLKGRKNILMLSLQNMGRSNTTFVTDLQKLCCNFRATPSTPKMHGLGIAILKFPKTQRMPSKSACLYRPLRSSLVTVYLIAGEGTLRQLWAYQRYSLVGVCTCSCAGRRRGRGGGRERARERECECVYVRELSGKA